MSEQTKQKLSRNWNRIEYEFERWVKFFVSQLSVIFEDPNNTQMERPSWHEF